MRLPPLRPRRPGHLACRSKPEVRACPDQAVVPPGRASHARPLQMPSARALRPPPPCRPSRFHSLSATVSLKAFTHPGKQIRASTSGQAHASRCIQATGPGHLGTPATLRSSTTATRGLPDSIERAGVEIRPRRGIAIRRSTRRHVALVVAGAMVAAVAIPAILSIPALRGDGPRDERPIVPLDRLLLPRPATGLPGDPAWSLYGTWQMDGRPRDNLARQWSGNGDDARLAQTVQRYATAADAHRAYLGSDPIARAAEQAESSAVPGSVPDGVDADTSVVGCVGGRPPECHVWIYWARY